MNDFTKEELESIWRWADAHSDKEWYKNLSEKIRPMIDNYCEHSKMEFDGDTYGYSCKNCEKQFTGQVIDADRHYQIITGEED